MNVELNNLRKNPLPDLANKKENCCGCSACYVACPTNSIIMKPDEEGFFYPTIIEEKCIRCYKCVSVCSFKKDQNGKGFYQYNHLDKLS